LAGRESGSIKTRFRGKWNAPSGSRQPEGREKDVAHTGISGGAKPEIENPDFAAFGSKSFLIPGLIGGENDKFESILKQGR
jgi:hypothetical protein